MRKVLKIALVFAILLFCNITVAKAATNEDLIAYTKKSFDVNGSTVTLKAADKVKVERYLKQYPVTDNQADQIIGKIDAGISLLRAANATDLTKLDYSYVVYAVASVAVIAIAVFALRTKKSKVNA